MMRRRQVLKVIGGAATWALANRLAVALPTKMRVTLIRWPYT